MSLKTWGACVCAIGLICAGAAGVETGAGGLSARTRPDQPKPAAEVSFVTAQELKAKLAASEPVTIIDVRASGAYSDSDGKIRGAIHVKERRLKARLALPPLRDVPRDAEVVIYCACPNDEASIRAAQLLTASGFRRARVLKGGWRAWLDAGGQLESKPRGI